MDKMYKTPLSYDLLYCIVKEIELLFWFDHDCFWEMQDRDGCSVRVLQSLSNEGGIRGILLNVEWA